MKHNEYLLAVSITKLQSAMDLINGVAETADPARREQLDMATNTLELLMNFYTRELDDALDD